MGKNNLIKRIAIIAIIILIALLALIIAIYWYAIDADNALSQAKRYNPLKEGQNYIIKELIQESKSADGTVFTNSFYVLCHPDEDLCLKDPKTKVPTHGRVIGAATKIDFLPYLDQPVYLYGEFYYGNAYTKNNVVEEDGKSNNPYLRIDQIELVDPN